MAFTIYILRTDKNTLYVGQTNDLARRMKEHEGKCKSSAKYLRMFSRVQLVYTETVHTRSLALKREAALKKLSKKKKEALIGVCSQCGLCCRLFFVNVNRKELETGIYETLVKPTETVDPFSSVQGYGGNIIRQHEDGSCFYMKHNLCSIHTKRPQVCRDFFCSSTAKKFKNMVRIINQKRNDDTMRPC